MTSQAGERRTLWLFKALIPGTTCGTLSLFYAPDEATAHTRVSDLLRRAEQRGQPLHFRRLEPRPNGFSTGKTE